MRKRKNFIEWNNVTPLSKYLAMALLIALPFAGFYFGMQYNNSSKITPKTVQKTESLIPSEDPRIPRDIKIIDTNINWENDGLYFSVTEAYLTPFYFNNGPDLRLVTPENYVVFKVDVRDKRVSGKRRSMNCSDYFRLRVDGKDTTPYYDSCNGISPQENQTHYVGLKVGQSPSPYVFMIGKFTSPRLVTLDYQKGNTRIEKGLVLMRQGFVKEYPGDFE